MTDIDGALTGAAFALFALEQPLSLEEIGAGARSGAFPAGANHTPEWFAAAAEGSDLLETAPELQVLPTDLEEADHVDLTGIDLIRVYAPELTGAPVDEAEEPAPVTPAPPPSAPKPGAATQIGLLKELGGLDD